MWKPRLAKSVGQQPEPVVVPVPALADMPVPEPSNGSDNQETSHDHRNRPLSRHLYSRVNALQIAIRTPKHAALADVTVSVEWASTLPWIHSPGGSSPAAALGPGRIIIARHGTGLI